MTPRRADVAVKLVGEAALTVLVGLTLGCSPAGTAAGQDGVNLSFWGAAREVSGACHLLEARGTRVLLDCGQLYAEEGEHEGELETRDRELPFEGSSIDALLVSHVHLDHIGRLPVLYRSGFRGSIHATKVSTLLAGEMLSMTFRYGDLGEEDFYGSRRSRVAHTRRDCEGGGKIAAHNRVEWSGHRDELDGRGRQLCRICVQLETNELLSLFESHEYGESFSVGEGIQAVFADAGHIPGSAMATVEMARPEGPLRITYTGDYGNGLHPYLRQPDGIAAADVLIVESTYGDQAGDLGPDPLGTFREAVRVALERNHRVVIPAFVLDRTQKVLAELGRGMQIGEIPTVPVYVTSRTANRFTDLYDAMSRERPLWGGFFTDSFFKGSLFAGMEVRRQGLRLRDVPRGVIVLSSSSDGQYGASRELIERYMGDPSTTFITVGWSPPQSPSGQLRETADASSGSSHLLLDGRRLPLRAHTVKIRSFSAHAGQSQLLSLVKGIKGLDHVYVTHGTPESADALVQAIQEARPDVDARSPKYGDVIALSGMN